MDNETREMFVKMFDAMERMELSMNKGFSDLRSDVSILKADVAELKKDMVEVKADVAELKKDVAELKADMKTAKENIVILAEGQDDIVEKLNILKVMYMDHEIEIRQIKKKIAS